MAITRIAYTRVTGVADPFVLTAPSSGLSVGDKFVAVIYGCKVNGSFSAAPDITTPSGWTKLSIPAENVGFTHSTHLIYGWAGYRDVTSCTDKGTSWSWDNPGDAFTEMVGWIIQYREAATGRVDDANSVSFAASASTGTLDTVADGLVVDSWATSTDSLGSYSVGSLIDSYDSGTMIAAVTEILPTSAATPLAARTATLGTATVVGDSGRQRYVTTSQSFDDGGTVGASCDTRCRITHR